DMIASTGITRSGSGGEPPCPRFCSSVDSPGRRATASLRLLVLTRYSEVTTRYGALFFNSSASCSSGADPSTCCAAQSTGKAVKLALTKLRLRLSVVESDRRAKSSETVDPRRLG